MIGHLGHSLARVSGPGFAPIPFGDGVWLAHWLGYSLREVISDTPVGTLGWVSCLELGW